MSDSYSDPVIDDGHRRAVGAPPDVPALPTRLTREYGTRHPFVGAGMGFIAHEQLAAAVTNAGGLGVLGASPDPADSLVRNGRTIARLDFWTVRRGPHLRPYRI